MNERSSNSLVGMSFFLGGGRHKYIRTCITYELLFFCLQEVHYSNPLPACGGTPPINKGRGVITHIATILYGAKLHNYLECKVIRMFFLSCLHTDFLTEEQKDIFFGTRNARNTQNLICSQRGQRNKGRRGAHRFFLGAHRKHRLTQNFDRST